MASLTWLIYPDITIPRFDLQSKHLPVRDQITDCCTRHVSVSSVQNPELSQCIHGSVCVCLGLEALQALCGNKVCSEFEWRSSIEEPFTASSSWEASSNAKRRLLQPRNTAEHLWVRNMLNLEAGGCSHMDASCQPRTRDWGQSSHGLIQGSLDKPPTRLPARLSLLWGYHPAVGNRLFNGKYKFCF